MSDQQSGPTPGWLEKNGLPLLVVLMVLIVAGWAITHPLTPEQRAIYKDRDAAHWQATLIMIGLIWKPWWVRLIAWAVGIWIFSDKPCQIYWRAERHHSPHGWTPVDSLGCSLAAFALIGFGALEAAHVDPMRWPYLLLSVMLITGPSRSASAAITNLRPMIRRCTGNGEHGY